MNISEDLARMRDDIDRNRLHDIPDDQRIRELMGLGWLARQILDHMDEAVRLAKALRDRRAE